MRENFLMFIFSPITLLFLINAFFMIFVASFVWNRFFNMKSTQCLIDSQAIPNKNPVLTKGLLLAPIVSIVIVFLLGMYDSLTRVFIRLAVGFILFV